MWLAIQYVADDGLHRTLKWGNWKNDVCTTDDLIDFY
jgi:hypothetical protein